MNHIPIELEREILSFLINSREMNTIFLINKMWNNLLKNTKFWKKFLLLIENLNMIQEDNGTTDKFLMDNWEENTKWIYPPNVFPPKIGSYVDVLDNINVWSSAIVKNIFILEEGSYEKRFEVEFLGWSEQFNESVSIEKMKPFGTKTLTNLDNISKLNDYHWIYYKEFKWRKIKIKSIQIKKNEILFNIDGSLEIIKKNEIKKNFKPCTNAFSLIINDKFIELENRIFKKVY